VWLDGSTIGGFTKPNFSPGRTSNFDLQFLTSTKQLNQQRLSADGMLIPHLTASPDRCKQCRWTTFGSLLSDKNYYVLLVRLEPKPTPSLTIFVQLLYIFCSLVFQFSISSGGLLFKSKQQDTTIF